MAVDTKKPASTKKKTAAKATKKSASKKATQNKQSRVEAEKKALDEIITKSSSAADKKKAIDEIKKQLADDIIKDRPTSAGMKKSAEALKKKASAAKVSAQQKILEQSYVSDPGEHLKRLADSFDTSARRWEMVVYPSLFAFILLAGYGFYLIFHLTHDISVLSQSVTRMATIVSNSMPRMTDDIQNMTGEVGEMSDQMSSLRPMSRNIANMTGTMYDMNRSVYGMQRDIGGMNRTVSGGPFGMMNDMMPFSTNSYSQPPRPYMQPMYAQPMPGYSRSNRRAPVQKTEKPANKKPNFVKDEIVKKGSSTNLVKKN